MGKCLAETARGTKLAPPLNKLVSIVLSAEVSDDEDAPLPSATATKAPAKSGSLLGKLTDLGTLLPKKKVKA